MGFAIKHNHDIHIAILSLLATSIRAEQPCFQHRLRSKIRRDNLL